MFELIFYNNNRGSGLYTFKVKYKPILEGDMMFVFINSRTNLVLQALKSFKFIFSKLIEKNI
jgi:hypothetical protein